MFVIARSRYERQLLRIWTPFNVSPLAAATLNVVAQSRTMLIGWQLKTDYAGRIDFNNHPLDRGHLFIAGQWILPGLQLRMTDAGVDQVHLADAALVLLKGGNLLRVR